MSKFNNLKKFDDYAKEATKLGELTEDGAPATVASVPGMGAPVLASRGVTGSGDVAMGSYKKKKKKTRVAAPA